MKNTRKGFTVIELIITVCLVFAVISVVGVVLGGLVGIGRIAGGVNSTYSESTRVGKIVKFGEKKNMFGGYKSWEGAMQMSEFGLASSNQINSTMNGNIWEFSLPPDASKDLTDKILLALKANKPISLTYRQWWSRPATISTEYVILSAEFPEEVKTGK